MKVSAWLREYQLTGKVPEENNGDSKLPFICGWLIGAASKGNKIVGANPSERIAAALIFAIQVAEYIEEQK